MKFVFKLNNILEIKTKLEEQEKINFSIAMDKLRQVTFKLQKVCERKQSYEDELKRILNNGSSVREIRQAEDGLEIMKMNVRIAELAVKSEEANVEKARERLNEAMRERKTYEKLKENAFEEFKKEFEIQEKKENDELVSYKYSTATQNNSVEPN